MDIEARGLRFDVDLDGPDGGVPVLLLHGFPQNRTQWRGVTPALHDAGLRTIAPDQRGYSPGARPADARAYALRECVADALAILDALGVDRAYVVGHDWGAGVAWDLAARHPERVRGLVAISVPHPRAFLRALLTSPDQMRRSLYMLVFQKAGRAEEILLAEDATRLRGLFNDSGLDRAAVDRYVEPLREPGALTAALNWYRALRPGNGRPTGPVTVPTTYLWSDGDTALGRAGARRCGDHVRAEYRFLQLPGVGHWIPDQAPDVVADAVLQTTRMRGSTGG